MRQFFFAVMAKAEHLAGNAEAGGSLQVLTQTLALVGTTGQGEVTPQNVIFASVVIVTLPMILVFIAVQGAFIRGLTGSGVE